MIEARGRDTARALGSSRRPVVLLGSATAVLLVIAVLWRDTLAQISLQELSCCSLVSTGVGYAFVVRATKLGFWSISGVYLLVSMCFHQGLLLSSAFGLAPPQIDGDAATTWFGTVNTKMAVVVVTVALLSLALFAGLRSLVRDREPKSLAPSEPRQTTYSGDFAVAGFMLLLGAVAVWYLIGIRALGPLFFLSSYHVWLNATSSSLVTVVYVAIGLGLVLSMASGARGQVSLFRFIWWEVSRQRMRKFSAWPRTRA